MKLFTYILDTKGGSDWTSRQTVLAESREEADRFILPDIEDGYFGEYFVVLAVKVTEFPATPCFWEVPEELED